MASKNYNIGLDDREFRRKLKALEERTAETQRIMERNLSVSVRNNAMRAPFAFHAPNLKGSAQELDVLKQKVEGFESTVKSSTKANEENSMSLAGMAKNWGALISIGTAGAFVNQIVSVRGEFQQLEIAFGTMLGNADKAQKLIGQLAQTAATTPFQLSDVTQGAKQLMAYGVQAGEINNKLLMLGDIASGLSLPLGDLIYLYGTTMTQGRMFTQDLRQFMGRGIPLAEELAKQFGVTKDKVGELVTAGKVGAKEFNQAMESMRANRFNNLMEAQSKSVTGQISNIKDSIEMMFNDIGKSSEGAINTALNGVSWIVEHYNILGRSLAQVVAMYGIIKSAIIVNTALMEIQTAGVVKYARGLKIATAAQGALNAVTKMNPYVLVASGIAAAVSATLIFRDRTNEAEEAQKRFNESLDEASRARDEQKQKTDEALRVIKDENTTRYEQHKALKLLQEMYPSLFGNMDIEMAKTLDLIKAQKQLNELRTLGTLDDKRKRVEDLKGELKKHSGNANWKQAKIAYEELKLAERDLMKTQAEIAEASITPQQRIVSLERYIKDLNKEKEALIAEQERQARNKGFNGMAPIVDPMLQVRINNINAQLGKTTDSLTRMKEAAPNISGISSEVKSATETVSRLNKEIADLRAGRGDTGGKSFADAIEERTKELKEAQAKLETLTGRSESKSGGASSKKGKSEAQSLLEERIRFEKSVRDQAQHGAEVLALDGLGGMARIEKEYEITLQSIGRLKDEYMTKFKASQEQANALYYDQEQQALKKKENATAEHYNSLQEKYATYTQQRKQIEEQAEKEANQFRDRGQEENALEVMRQRDEDLKAVDLAFAMRSEEFEAWTNQVANMSLEKLQSTLDTAKVMLEATESEGGGGSEKIAVLRATITKLQWQIKNNGAKKTNRTIKEWQDLNRVLGDVNRSFSEIGDSVGGVVGEIISSAGTIATQTSSMISGIVELSNWSVKSAQMTAEGVSGAIQKIEKASVILAVISSGLQIVRRVSKWFTTTTELTQAQREEYQSLIRSTNELADANRKLMESLSGPELQRKYEETVKIIKNGIDSSRKYMNDYLGSGEKRVFGFVTKNSAGEQLKRDLFAYRDDIEKALGQSVGTWTHKSFWGYVTNGIELDWLNTITPEQIGALKSSPALWAKLGGELQGILQGVLDADEQLKNTDIKRLEGFTSTTSDALRDDMLGFLDELNENIEAPAQTFEKSMRNAMKRVVRDKYLTEAMNDYYKRFAEAGSDSVFTQQEVDSLRLMYTQMSEEAKRRYDAMTSVLGGTPGADDPRSASEKGIATASQDSIDTLVGLWHTSVQISDLHAKRFAVYADTVQDLQVKGWQDVKAIRDFTESINRSTMSIDTTMKDMSTNGVKMK